MAANPDEVRKAAMAELARRELGRRQSAKPQTGMQAAGNELARQPGLAARMVVEGGADIAAPFANAAGAAGNLLTSGYNALQSRFGKPYEVTIDGEKVTRSGQLDQLGRTDLSGDVSSLLTKAGLPEPESTSEKVANFGGRLATSVAASGPLANAVTGRMGLPTAQQPAQKIPTTDELKKYANQAYKAADDAGVVINKQSFAARVGDISKRIADEGIDETLHPRATAALKRLQAAADDTAAPLSLQDAEILRRVVKNASSSLQADERRIARIMTEQLDDYVRNLEPSDVIAGNASAASAALRDARGLWSRMSKGEVVEELIENAGTRASQFSGSGYENALRTEFRKLVMNPKRFRMFTVPEQKALKRVAEGGPLENFLRMVGKAAPTGVVSSALGTGAGYAVGGPIGAAAVPAAGFAARQGATALTMRNAALASELMRQGARPPLMQAAPKGGAQAVGGINSLLAQYLSNPGQ